MRIRFHVQTGLNTREYVVLKDIGLTTSPTASTLFTVFKDDGVFEDDNEFSFYFDHDGKTNILKRSGKDIVVAVETITTSGDDWLLYEFDEEENGPGKKITQLNGGEHVLLRHEDKNNSTYMRYLNGKFVMDSYKTDESVFYKFFIDRYSSREYVAVEESTDNEIAGSMFNIETWGDEIQISVTSGDKNVVIFGKKLDNIENKFDKNFLVTKVTGDLFPTTLDTIVSFKKLDNFVIVKYGKVHALLFDKSKPILPFKLLGNIICKYYKFINCTAESNRLYE